MKFSKPKAAAAAAAALSLALSAAALAVSSAPGGWNNLELTTYRNVCVGGQMSAVDPEGDAMTYEITTQPRKGQRGRHERRPLCLYAGREQGRARLLRLSRRGRDGRAQQGGDGYNKDREAAHAHRLRRHGGASGALRRRRAGRARRVQRREGGRDPDVLPRARSDPAASSWPCAWPWAGASCSRGVAATGFADDAEIDAWLKPTWRRPCSTG